MVNAFTTGNPFLGTKLLGFSIGRGSGALKGLSVLVAQTRLHYYSHFDEVLIVDEIIKKRLPAADVQSFGIADKKA